jgi:hypothetical protein
LTILGASPAVAGTLTLDFTLDTASGLSFSPVTGSARVVLTGVDASGTPTGTSPQGSLQSLRILTSSDFDMTTTEILLQQPVGGAFERMGFPSNADLLQTTQCAGGADVCRGIPNFDSPIVLSLKLEAFVFVANPGTPGPGFTLSGLERNRLLANVTISGREVSRTFVPEPLAGGLLLLGLAAIARRELRSGYGVPITSASRRCRRD